MRNPCVIISSAALVFLSACGSDTTGPANEDTPGMSARIAGQQWSAMSITTDTAPPSLRVVSGSNGSATLSLIIPTGPGVGLQRVGSTTPIAAVLVMNGQSWAASRTQGGAGSVTVTTIEAGRIAGTFEFTLAREGNSPAEQQVTSGRFDVRY